jgi:hypothetical protein
MSRAVSPEDRFIDTFRPEENMNNEDSVEFISVSPTIYCKAACPKCGSKNHVFAGKASADADDLVVKGQVRCNLCRCKYSVDFKFRIIETQIMEK